MSIYWQCLCRHVPELSKYIVPLETHLFKNVTQLYFSRNTIILQIFIISQHRDNLEQPIPCQYTLMIDNHQQKNERGNLIDSEFLTALGEIFDLYFVANV